ncbi:MAG: AraC family transcriptional regulator [Paludibacteraceae bacterium]|nr:AraC family transcriptional regulator [Paludibacteraceae bacterium]
MSLFDLSYYAMMIALILFSCVFLAFPLPKGKELATYSYTLKFLSVSYAFLGIFCIIKHHIPIDVIGLPFFVNAIFQAHMLGNSHLNMINSKSVKLKNIAILTSPAILLIGANLILVQIYGYHKVTDYSIFFENTIAKGMPDIFVREVIFFYYIAICIHYIVCFYLEAARAKKRIDNYTSDAHYQGLRYIHASFAMTICVVITSLCQTLSCTEEWCSIFNFAILASYLGLGLFYIQYPKNYYSLLKSGLGLENMEEKETKIERIDEQANWAQWKSRIINEELYTKAGLTIIQLAQDLCTNRTTLSTAINQYEDINFNAFINNLRINKAKELMANEPKLSLTDICLQVGYTDPANFSRHFKNITGNTPLAWRKNLG